MSDLRRTPLHDFNLARGARMVDFAGWEMPVQFDSIVSEHQRTRKAAGLFDVSHMGEAIVEGPDAERFLNYVLTNDVSVMEEGRALYSLMCYENGGVVDDLLIYRLGKEKYLLCLNASNTEKDMDWLDRHAGDFEVSVTDVSEQYGLIALQGPKSLDILNHLTDFDLKSLNYYHVIEASVGSSPCIVSRTGYTGSLGYELFVKADYAEELAEELLREGEGTGLALAGLGARDSLRLEAGYSLYGHEISESISPVQARLMWTVKLTKRHPFIGQDAIEKELVEGPRKRIFFFRTGDRRIVRSGTTVQVDGTDVGHVVSGTFSPQLNEAIGSALVESTARKEKLAVDIRGKKMPLIIVKPPFIDLNP